MASSPPAPLPLLPSLSCALCRDVPRDPVTLACGHCLCRGCLERAWRGQENYPTCPKCRPAQVQPPDGVQRGACAEHGEKLQFYSPQEGRMLCTRCPGSAEQHAAHALVPIQEAVGGYKDELISAIAPLESRLKELQQMQCAQEQMIAQHRGNLLSTKHQVSVEFEKLHQFLREREERLLRELQQEGDLILAEMEESLSKIKQNCQGILQTISTTQPRLYEQDPISFLTDIKSCMEICYSGYRDGFPAQNVVAPRDFGYGGVKDLIQYTAWKDMKSYISPALPNIIMDPSTAHLNLILSDDLTSVRYSDTKQSLPENPRRFDYCCCVLGTEGFSSGRHYWAVEVGNKTKWNLGVAKESVNRRGGITLSPENGFWILWLRNGHEFKALDVPYRALTLRSKPQRVGILLDHEGGLLSFYNADDMSHIYTFVTSFTETVYPYFCPCLNDSGKNGGPLKVLHHIP
ncbi:zinc-binding protein A33-like isoform X4 [Spea bombifrons]|nr:zinc-binding protein A33-like isoform X4 [Spea bombifrons]XP_053326515.1 zinc-binding protein A33-like isoform X4 [Spea bombifrons]XP_053326516.1 zinc-binding protein A33-like isoform X4 [Spea bombifrons]XP_053326517.1 zinc-binding protein A33-like isoform X4 [Spea bombifrons]